MNFLWDRVMKLCVGISKGWNTQDIKVKDWVDVLQSKALSERVFEFDLPDYKLLNGNEVKFSRQLYDNIQAALNEKKLTPKLLVLPFQHMFGDEAECLDKIAFYCKKIFRDKSKKEPLVLIVGSAFYDYKHADFVDYAQYLLTKEQESLWQQNKELKEKSVLSIGVPFRLSRKVCEEEALQPEQAQELQKFDVKIPTALFVLGGVEDNFQIKFDVADALRMADRALDFAAKGYRVIFINQPSTPTDVTDFIFDFCLRNKMFFYNRKEIVNLGDVRATIFQYNGQNGTYFEEQKQRCGDMYPAILKLIMQNGVYVGTMGDVAYISDALALKLRTVVYGGNNVAEKRYDCLRLLEICQEKQYVFGFYDDKVFDLSEKLRAFPSVNESILKLLINKKFKKFKIFEK